MSTPELSRTRCLVIGEVGIAHDGSLGAAHAFVDAIAGAGADAVKFQTHIASAESTPSEPFRVRFSPQDATRYEFWRRLEFTEDEWRGLADHARDHGLLFLSSPFSMEAVDVLTRVGIRMWKVASGEVGNLAMLDRLVATGRPIILSSGMSDLSELDAASARVKAAGLPLAVLQCTTAYPCPPERVGLNMLLSFRERYGSFVGLSDHSGTIYPALAGSAIGMDVFETHVTLSRDAFGPDVRASVTPDELRQIVDGIRFIESMRANPVDKDTMAREMAPLRDIFTKSVVARRALPAGAVLAEADLAVKKPGTGIPGNRLAEVIGRRLRRALTVDELLRAEDLEEPL